jgi:LPS export ABC transporter permease LptF
LKILRNYVLSELQAPFIFSMGLLCSFLLFGKAITQILKMDIPLAAVGRVGMWLIPEMLTYAIPMSFLLACLMGFGRLAGDREILAMKASGVNIVRLALPVNAIALGVAFLLLLLSSGPLPRARYRARWEGIRVGAMYPARIIPEGEFIEVFEGLRLYVERKDPEHNRLLHVKIDKQDEKGNKILIQAAYAEIQGSFAENDLRIILNEGSVTEVRADNPGVIHKMDFQKWEETLKLGEDALNPKLHLRPDEMTLLELKHKIANYFNDPEEAGRKNRLNIFRCELHERWTRPFAIFVFALVGVPLAIGGKTGGRTRSFAFSFFVFASYYLLMLPTQTLGEEAKIPPLLAMWIPNLVLSIVGIVLYIRVALE